MQIARRRRQMIMAEEPADAVEIDAAFEQVRGEGVAQTVDAAFRGDAGGVARRLVDPLRGLDLHRAAAAAVGEQPPLRPGVAPVSPQGREQTRRQQRLAILAALAVAQP
jgi:hypothetical protein